MPLKPVLKIRKDHKWWMTLPDGNSWELWDVSYYPLTTIIRHALDVWKNFWRK